MLRFIDPRLQFMLALISQLLFLSIPRAGNFKKPYRGRQLLIAFIAPLFAILACSLAYRLFERIQAWVNFILTLLHLESLNLSLFESVQIWNALIVVLWIIVKRIIKPVSNKVMSSDERMESMCGKWYGYDSDNNLWFLKEEYTNLRSLLNGISWAVQIFAAVYIAMSSALGASSDWSYVAFPSAVVIVVTEICNFLNGMTKPEYEQQVYGEDAHAHHFANYHKLKEVLAKLFEKPLITSYTGSEFIGKSGGSDYLKQLADSDDPVDRVTAEYYNGLKHTGSFDADLIAASNQMLHQKNVIVLNPFYRDMSDYVLLPLLTHLLKDEKVLVVVGRNSMVPDVIGWLNEILKDYSRTSELFRVKQLSRSIVTAACEVGIIDFAQMYDLEVLDSNKEFFEQCGFVLMLEPSRMLATAQTALGIIARQVKKNKEASYCILDHDEAGLVDTLSHVLLANITTVSAAKVPDNVYTLMSWDAAGDYKRDQLFNREVQYLGNGVEIAATALRNQIPHVSWYSEERAPVCDIQWIAGQYYPQITRYAHLPIEQKSLEKAITFSPYLWSSRAVKEDFVIAEDERYNYFATAKEYATRATDQIFVNIISDNYMLREYMQDNQQIFLTDAGAVPAIVPSFVKTERNIVYSLLIRMACGYVKDMEINEQLMLLGYETDDPEKILRQLIEKYTGVKESILTIRQMQDTNDELIPVINMYYTISREAFGKAFAGTLRNAFFVVEDEKIGSQYIDAKLYEHMTQLVMPGQYVTYGGKYYRVKRVGKEIGCVLNRAADNYAGREYYRQARTYHFMEGSELVSSRRIMDMEVTRESREFDVSTSGYWKLDDNGNLAGAKFIDLSKDPSIQEYSRHYLHKQVLKLVLPGTDEKARWTMTLLLQEMLRTIFPESWQYIAVLTKFHADEEDEIDQYLYHAEGDLEEDAIYVVEDSDMDLGLTEAVENNLQQILEVMDDYIDWQIHPAETEKHQEIQDVKLPEDQPVEQAKKEFFLKRWGRKIGEFFGRLFHHRKKEEEIEPAEETGKPEEEQAEEAPVQESPDDREKAMAVLSARDDQEDPFTADAEVLKQEKDPVLKSENRQEEPEGKEAEIPAMKGSYLLFGFEEPSEKLALAAVLDYLNERGFGSNNALSHARKRQPLNMNLEELSSGMHCDFCGRGITGVSYDRLMDGRIRCSECSTTAVTTVEEFTEIFDRVKLMMEDTFDITLQMSIGIRMTDAQTVGKMAGKPFVPESNEGRVLGVAVNKNGQFTIYIENGAPRLATIEVLSHELTHIWQYRNWDAKRITQMYGNGTNRLMVYEGMAVWTSIEILYVLGEIDYAQMQEYLETQRQDVYGSGIRAYIQRYGMMRDGQRPEISPFHNDKPL